MIDELYLFPQMRDGKLKYESDPPDTGSVFLSLLPTIIMVVALGFLFYIMMNQGGNGKAFQFAKSRAKMVRGGEKKVTFADVAGLDEEKLEMCIRDRHLAAHKPFVCRGLKQLAASLT